MVGPVGDEIVGGLDDAPRKCVSRSKKTPVLRRLGLLGRSCSPLLLRFEALGKDQNKGQASGANGKRAALPSRRVLRARLPHVPPLDAREVM